LLLSWFLSLFCWQRTSTCVKARPNPSGRTSCYFPTNALARACVPSTPSGNHPQKKASGCVVPRRGVVPL
jgi:hypothetical protein